MTAARPAGAGPDAELHARATQLADGVRDVPVPSFAMPLSGRLKPRGGTTS